MHGSTALAGITDSRISDLYKYCTHGHVFYGTNDLGSAGVSKTPAAMLSRVQALRSQMKAGGIGPVGASHLLVRASSTDLWVTEENQTTFTGWGSGGNPELFNALLDADPDWAYIVTNDAVRGVDPYKWAVTGVARGVAYDDTHPSNGGATRMSVEAIPLMEAV